MKLNEIDITIGKSYPASQILEKVQEKPKLEIQFGHILVEYKTEKRHKYFIDTDFIVSLKDTPVKVYTIIPRHSLHNFACKLLEQKDVREVLENIENDHSQICLIDETDLSKVNCNNISTRKIVSLINKALKANKMNFRASSDKEGIMIKYKKLKETEGLLMNKDFSMK